MNEFFKIEKVLNTIDFSQGREKAIWDKIAARLPHCVSDLHFSDFDDVGGGVVHFFEDRDKLNDSKKNKL